MRTIAGVTLERARGSKTSVFIGSFLYEYDTLLNRDYMIPHKYKAQGTSPAILANRLSWFYDLRGPSMTIDTACSSSMNALYLSCQSIWSGESEMESLNHAVIESTLFH